MNKDAIRKLIEETLENRRTLGAEPSSSFVVNQASRDIRKVGSAALPEIEGKIKKCLVPEAAAMDDPNTLIRMHPGLLSLWMAYYSIAQDGQILRVVGFVRSLDGAILASALLAMRRAWSASDEASKKMPAPVFELLEEIAGRTSSAAANTAKHLLEDVGNRV